MTKPGRTRQQRTARRATKPGPAPRTPSTPPAPAPPAPSQDDPRQLRTPASILRLIERTIHAVLQERVSPEAARLLLYGGQVATGAMRTLLLDEKLADIERRIGELEGNQR